VGFAEHRRVADIAQLYVDREIVTMRRLADRLGCPPATVATYVNDRTGQDAVRARHLPGSRSPCRNPGNRPQEPRI